MLGTIPRDRASTLTINKKWTKAQTPGHISLDAPPWCTRRQKRMLTVQIPGCRVFMSPLFINGITAQETACPQERGGANTGWDKV